MTSRTWIGSSFLGVAAATLGLSLVHCTPADGPEPAVNYTSQPQLSGGPLGQPTLGPVGAGVAGSAAGPATGGGTVAPSPTAGTAGTGPAMMGTAGVGAPPVGGSGGVGAAGTTASAGASGGAAGGGAPTSALSMLTFEFTTKALGGKWGPKNVGAVWVEDTSGKWIHTLEFWARTPNDKWISRYIKDGGPDYAQAGDLDTLFGITSTNPKPPADVVSGPTLNMPAAHTKESWMLKDLPDGAYKLVIEVTESDTANSGKVQEIPFTKGPMPVMDMPADTQYYTGMKLTLQ